MAAAKLLILTAAACAWPSFGIKAELSLPNAGKSGFNLHVYAPSSNGDFPVIFFVPGFEGDAPVSLYSDLIRRIVEKGYIIVGADHVEFPDYPKGGRNFLHVLSWAEEGLEKALRENWGAESPVPDVRSRAAVMGQSEGNHDVGMALALNCSIAKAAVLIDPVDGVDPYGVIKNQNLIKVGEKLNFSIPALILDNGLDDKANFAEPPCMPPAMGTSRWMKAWRGPFWRINATEYGHVDCLDSTSAAVGKLLCPSHLWTKKADYRSMLADAIHLFLGALFSGEKTLLAELEDPQFTSINVTVDHDLKGLTHDEISTGCRNVQSSVEVIV